MDRIAVIHVLGPRARHLSKLGGESQRQAAHPCRAKRDWRVARPHLLGSETACVFVFFPFSCHISVFSLQPFFMFSFLRLFPSHSFAIAQCLICRRLVSSLPPFFSASPFLSVDFQVLISTSTTLFHYLKCHSFEKPEIDGGGEESFLYLDYSLDCLGERYAEYLPFCLGKQRNIRNQK